MARKKTSDDPVVDTLNSILSVLQDLLIIQAKQAGMKKAQVRNMLGVANDRVSETWRLISGPSNE